MTRKIAVSKAAQQHRMVIHVWEICREQKV